MPADRKLLIVTSVFGSIGGIEKFNELWISTLAKMSPPGTWKVISQLDGTQNTAPETAKIRIEGCGGKDNSILAKIRVCFKVALSFLNPNTKQIVVGHIQLAPPVYLFSLLTAKKYSILIHGIEISERVTPIKRLILRRAQFIYCNSRYTRSLCGTLYSIPDSKFKLFFPPVDEATFTPGDTTDKGLSATDMKRKRILVSVARLTKSEGYKGIDSTLRALPIVLEKFQIEYLVVGDGDDQGRLKNLASSLGVMDSVKFIGRVSNAELLKFYQRADCFVLPSMEGFGIVYLEALCCGVPVIAGNQDGSSDPLQDGKLGWHVPRQNENAIAQAILEVLVKKDIRTDSSYLRDETIKKFGLKAFEKNVQNLFG